MMIRFASFTRFLCCLSVGVIALAHSAFASDSSSNTLPQPSSSLSRSAAAVGDSGKGIGGTGQPALNAPPAVAEEGFFLFPDVSVPEIAGFEPPVEVVLPPPDIQPAVNEYAGQSPLQ